MNKSITLIRKAGKLHIKQIYYPTIYLWAPSTKSHSMKQMRGLLTTHHRFRKDQSAKQLKSQIWRCASKKKKKGTYKILMTRDISQNHLCYVIEFINF